MKTFADLGVADDIVEALAAHGIINPFPIQALAIPLALKDHDLIGQARTGTGKTLGFRRPDPAQDRRRRATASRRRSSSSRPASSRRRSTRDIDMAGANRGIRVLTIYGGRAYEPQLEALQQGRRRRRRHPRPAARPRRPAAPRPRRRSRCSCSTRPTRCSTSASCPTSSGSSRSSPTKRQTMLFSATMPGPVVALARRYLTQPTHVRARVAGRERARCRRRASSSTAPTTWTSPRCSPACCRPTAAACAWSSPAPSAPADQVADDLAERGFAAAAVHGDLGQGAREQALRAFRTGKVDVLVATDVAARGIDVAGVTHVVNYQCPDDEKTYLHRIGRTGRAGETGVADHVRRLGGRATAGA